MYIRNTKNNKVPDEHFVTTEDIICKIFEIAPTIVFLPLVSYDFGNYIATIPEHCNNIFLDYLTDSEFSHIIDHYFIEVIEDASFNYEYGDICGTHHTTTLEGYVPRTPEFEAISCEPWDDDYYWR